MAGKTGLEKMYPQVKILPMFTTYYSMCDKLDKDKYLIVKVFRSEKIGFYFIDSGCLCYELYPSAELLKEYKSNNINEKEYREIYAKQLTKLDAKSLLYSIYNICAGGVYNHKEEGWLLAPDPDSLSYKKHLVFVCLESPEKFCHRHMIAEWLRFNGYECSELEF